MGCFLCQMCSNGTIVDVHGLALCLHQWGHLNVSQLQHLDSMQDSAGCLQLASVWAQHRDSTRMQQEAAAAAERASHEPPKRSASLARR